MKRICIISIGNPKKQPRVRKQINYFLEKGYDLTIIANEESFENLRFFKIRKPSLIQNIFRMLILLKTKLYDHYTWNKESKKVIEQVSKLSFDLVVIHGIRNIALGHKIANGCKILLDAHEYYPENFSDDWIWRFLVRDYYYHLSNKYLNKVDFVTTVAPGIINLYKENFGIKNIDLITNSANYEELEPKEVSRDHIKIIHHGDCSSSRRLELMIKAAKYFNKNIHLYLMLVVSRGYKNYYKKLKRLASGLKNVHFIEPVPSELIVKSLNDFDIGLVFLPPTNKNLYFVLPNKFFEFIQARLMVITGPSIEMAKYIDKYNIGVQTNSFEIQELANLINGLSVEEIMGCKKKSNLYAKELSYEGENKDKFERIVNYLLNI